jgi:hypothetical protein
MAIFDKDSLCDVLQDDLTLRSVEDRIYSVFPTNEHGNEYDSQLMIIGKILAGLIL